MSEVIKSYKGFDKDLKCRGFQYEIGREYEEKKAVACNSGFHACEVPLDVLGYYPPATSRYCEVEQDGQFSRDGGNSKVASTKIKIGAEIGIPGLVKAHVEYVRSHCTNEHNADPGKPATAGYKGAATSRGSVSVGENGVGTVRGDGVKIKGGMGAILVCAVEKACSFDIATWAAVVVDGEKIKADTWYTVKNGKFVEVK